jgi:hypothetical protein
MVNDPHPPMFGMMVWAISYLFNPVVRDITGLPAVHAVRSLYVEDAGCVAPQAEICYLHMIHFKYVSEYN